MNVFITGADGMLGSNTVRALLAKGHKVTAFLLKGSNAKTLEGLEIRREFGNILQSNDLLKATRHHDAIIHAAANTNIWPNRSDIVRKVNVEGTQNVVQAALKNNIPKLIYIGTANSFGFGTKENPGTEKNDYQSAKYGLDYMDSKLSAQEYVLRTAATTDLEALTINPTFMFGPYDSKPGAGAMILAIYNNKVPGFAVGGRNYVNVKDVSAAICNALELGKSGESYIAGNKNMNYKEAFSKIAEVIGVKAPTIKIPPLLTKTYGYIGTKYGEMFDKTPTVSLAMAQISCDEHYFSAAKAVKELKMPQTPIEQGIRECFEWLKENGYCD